ncbi:MAG: type VI secretion system-associated FHA domain protein TagH, partial [Nitrospirota bacterium]
MPFTLVIRSPRDQEGTQASERVFDQPVVTIGRAITSDLVLKDPQRMVSSRHGEIRRRGSSWILVDLGSTNGTALNEVRLTARNEYGLKDGDRITLGDILLTFKSAIPPQEASGASQPVRAQRGQPISGDEIQTLRYLLRRAYADSNCVSNESRHAHVQQLLRQSVGHLDRQSLQVRLDSLRRSLSDASVSMEPEKRAQPVVLPPASIPPPRREKSALATSDFPGLAEAFFGDLGEPLSRAQLDEVVRRIEQVVHVVCAGLADAVKGRREFQREFEVEATRILDWAPNPIKHAETAKEIASLLLDPRSQGLPEEQAKAFLQEVFHDLTLHQLGLMAGFRECVRGLLKEFDPMLLTKGEKRKSIGKGLGLLGGKGARTDAAAWQRFLEKYRQLTEEEVRVFEQILAPHFAKG